MTDSEVIDAMGGTKAVAGDCGVSLSVVSQWRKRGISWRYRNAIIALADHSGLRLPSDFGTESRV